MKDRFSGERGTALLVEALQNQRLFTGVPHAAQAISALGELVEVSKDGVLIEQNATDNDVYFTISGSFGVFVNSKRVATRYPGDTVGEMAAVSVTQRRSADVVADEDCLVFKVPEAGFCQVADKTPVVWRRLAQELSKRLIQRNALIRPPHEKIRVFVISSAEALHVARAVENAFAHDPFLTVVWANGVFKVTNYTLETL
ncbi:cyclic nucleotide-binding domain-containing protein, partial [Mesorhizobium sp. M4B.F.Ca.ET.049.02.1.2]|uniref:Crp/Fnr family transcriptional regulator n=1 Tax=Mesorhizobium sp. M4B.F.Ca.ET.049.02.1.2 TaxID=2496752 RepID=UPI000FCBD0CF